MLGQTQTSYPLDPHTLTKADSGPRRRRHRPPRRRSRRRRRARCRRRERRRSGRRRTGTVPVPLQHRQHRRLDGALQWRRQPLRRRRTSRSAPAPWCAVTRWSATSTRATTPRAPARPSCEVAPTGQVKPVRPDQPEPARLSRAASGSPPRSACSTTATSSSAACRSPTQGTGTPEAGCLIVLNSAGVPVETWAGHGINGPWDMTSAQLFGPFAELFVTNVLNGTVAAAGNEVNQGTVLRLSVFDPPGVRRSSSARRRSPLGSPRSSTPAPSSSARPGWLSNPTAPCTSPTRSTAGSPPSPSPRADSSPSRAVASPSARAGASTRRSVWRWHPVAT